MADRINWNMLAGPNPIDHALDGFQSGRRDRLAQERQAATLAQREREEARAAAGEKREIAEHEAAMAKAKADRELASNIMRVDGLASAAQDLLDRMPEATPDQYKAAALQGAANLAKYGINPDEIANMPVEHFSRQALLGTINTAMGFKAQQEQRNNDREAQLARDEFVEKGRHNLAMEANGATNADANLTRSKQSGGRAKTGGGVKLPTGFILD